MFGLLVIVGQLWGEPWYGKHTGLIEGLPTGLRDGELAGGSFLSVPGPVAAQRHTCATLHGGNAPPRACCHPAHTQCVGADAAVPRAPLVLSQPSDGVTVTDSHCHGPAGARRAHALVSAQRQSGGEKGCEGWGGCSLALLWGGGLALPSPPHDLHEAPRHHRVPQATPGLELGARFARVGSPPCRGLRPGGGRAEQRAFVAGDTATLGGGGGRPLLERGVDRETSHDLGCRGQLPARVLGAIAPGSQAPAGPAGARLRHAGKASAGQRTAGLIRPVEALGWRCFARACASHGDAAAVAGPPCAGDRPAAQPAVHAPPGAVCLPGGARAIAIAGEPCDMEAGFFLGRLVEAHPDDLACGDPWRCQADDGPPEVPAVVREGTPKDNIEAGKGLHGSGPGQPPRGGNGMAVPGQSPATGQGGAGVPRRGGQEIVNQ